MSGTETVVTVTLRAVSRCPLCGKSVEIVNELEEHSIVTGNETQMASYWAKSMRAQVQSEIIRRGWAGDACGTCRDDGPPERRTDSAITTEKKQ